MEGLDKWLGKRGLGDYAGVFAENTIDREMLPVLSDADLKELGIPLGHRQKILKSVGALAGDGVKRAMSTASTTGITSRPLLPDTDASFAA